MMASCVKEVSQYFSGLREIPGRRPVKASQIITFHFFSGAEEWKGGRTLQQAHQRDWMGHRGQLLSLLARIAVDLLAVRKS
jgi:hypothetical protein